MNPTLKSLLTAGAFAVLSVAAFASEKIVAGPKGGRLLEMDGQRAEFFVTADKKAEVTFYDASLKPVSPGEHTATLVAEPASGRTTVELEKTGSGFVSAAPLPAGEPYRVVLQLRAKPNAKPQNFRIDLDLEECGGCKRAEYACTCDE